MTEPKTVLPLHTQNPQGRFSDRASDYARYRPSYPTAAIEQILEGCTATELQIADIGAGTGISSRLFADRGATVLAIEPNEAMRQAAQPHPKIRWLTGSAEATGLASDSVDLVTCCQAFHWFEPEGALAEFARILHPGGRVVLMWNDRDRANPLIQDYTQTIRKAADPIYFERLERKRSDASALQNSSRFTHFRSQMFANQQRLDRDGLIGSVLSASYIPKAGSAYSQLIADLHDFHDRWHDSSGQIVFTYQTHLFLAESFS